MTFPTKKPGEPSDVAKLETVAPAFHMDAILRALEATDELLEPLTSRGMDGRTATILREIEKSGAISVRTEGDDLWIDVVDRSKALSILDRLAKELNLG
ncbi:MAG: hypothetical protein CMK07_01435 [Ponticaulis sp.]|nr:hypothetical protein [Ponticaulis sp.]